MDHSSPDGAQFNPNWNDMYIMGSPSGASGCFVKSNQSVLICTFPDSDGNTDSDTAEAVGHLSLDENSEVMWIV
jgi:hypothetical protein